MIEISLYDSSMSHEWNEAVRQSRNGTFLIERAYMDYHSDRFSDWTLVARRAARIVGLLPANRNGDTLYSHQGLTYGSWIVPFKHFDATVMTDIVDASVDFMRSHGIGRLIYKPVPHIYHRYPADDDLYALWRKGAKWAECNISTAIDLNNPIPLDRGNKSGLKTAMRSGVTVGESTRLPEFWQILTCVLQERHSTMPVHTLAEMKLLQSRFPKQIRLYAASADGIMTGGTLVYVCGPVAHCQYIAANDHGRETHALTAVFTHVAEAARHEGCRYLDFGISNEDHGLYLNAGLVQQKARLGGRGVAYNTLQLDITQ